MNNKYSERRKGLTLISLLIVILVIGILATMMVYSSSEAVATAKAAKILANLHLLRRAAIAWYADNRDKVQSDGRVKVESKKDPKPIQELTDEEIKLSSYLSHLGATEINLNKTYNDSSTHNTNTDLGEGCYGICDGGTVKNSNSTVIEFHRNAWYVGYRFTASEGKIKEKIRSRQKSSGVLFGTSDAHDLSTGKDDFNVDSKKFAAVWVRVL